jgi:hypothetical protein
MMCREGGVDEFEQFEDSLFTSAKHLDGVEITPKSFIYSPSTATAAVPQIQGQPHDFGGRKGVHTAKPVQPSSLALPAVSNAVMEGRLSGGGAGLAAAQGPRGRFSFPLEASISSPVASIASPNQKSNTVSNTVASTSASAGVSAGAVESIPSSIKMSRSGSDSQLPHNAGQSNVKATASHSPPSYLGGGASLLPLSISNPQDSLEMLGASLDLHQEEMEGNGQVDGHGYEDEEEGDELQEEGAERESIGMSSKPFRVCYHRMIIFNFLQSTVGILQLIS